MNTVPFTPLIGECPAIRRARELIERYAPTGMSILVVGATGTGKEVVAQHVHASSGRRGPFVPVNCGALPNEMIEGLLFGHRKGAFSGAIDSHRGFIECADGGTLFLDEVTSLSLGGQPKLLRAIETREVQALGAERARSVNVRFVAAVQDHLGSKVDRGDFRRDLYQRLADVVIELPPLARRQGDLALIATHFATLQGRKIAPDAIAALETREWPGNVRELRQVLERAGHLVANGTLPKAAVVDAMAFGAYGDSGSRMPKLDLNPARLATVCAEHSWHGGKAAAALGIHRATLFRRLRTFGLSLRQLRESHQSRATPCDCDSATVSNDQPLVTR